MRSTGAAAEFTPEFLPTIIDWLLARVTVAG